LVRTDLNVFKPGEQKVIMNHGWALADAAIRSFCSTLVPNPPPGMPPDRNLLDDPSAAIAALDGR
jgi:hypothetical protein